VQWGLFVQRVAVERNHHGWNVDRVAAQEDRRLRVDLEVGASSVGDAEAAVVEAGTVRLALQQLVRTEAPLRRAVYELDLKKREGIAA